MKTSESLGEFWKAYMQAHKAIGVVKKDKENEYYQSKYADFAAVVEAVKPPLNEAGIFYIQTIDSKESGPILSTTLHHLDSGEWILMDLPIICRDSSNPQAFGSAMTYAKRYSLQTICGLPAAEDDDGNAGANKNQKKKQGKQNQGGYNQQNQNNNSNNNRKLNQSREGGADSTQKKFQEAKDQLLAEVEKLRETAESTMKDIDFLEKVGREILKKTRPVSIEDVRKLWAAIVKDKVFDLATGERIP